ncbi:MAG: ATP-binding protein [Cytophagales bacterium]|nr:ATP-binding protein [Cytophagales bacterium]
MIQRMLTADLALSLELFPAVALLGARQVGKTTLAKYLASQHNPDNVHYLDLENPIDFEKLKTDAYTYLQQWQDSCVVIDEVQRIPELFTTLRPLIDAHRVPGRFLLLGSASPTLIKGVSESLAGRISYVNLHPFSLIEIQQQGIDLQTHWFRGGFPSAVLAKSDAQFRKWTDDFINTYIERDLSYLFDVNLPSSTIRAFWAMLANSNGGIWNAAAFARALGISNTTVNRYLDFLEGAYLVRTLPAWYINAKKRVIKSPKVYISDTGILHRLCRINTFEQLQENVAVGASWEGYVIENIMKHLPRDWQAFYYRTQHGAECDLVLVDGIKPIVCIEIKKSANPTVSRGFYESIRDLETTQNYLITPNSDTYKLNNDCTVTSLISFLNQVIIPKLTE